MSQTITAIYENGVLRPLEPLDLPEHTQVEIELHPADLTAHAQSRRGKVRAALTAAGLISISTTMPFATPLSEGERAALATRLGAVSGSPLSAMIIEEREND